VKTRISNRGSVSVQCINGTLRIRLPRKITNGKQICLYFGQDNPTNKRKADILALQIEQDIEDERLDTSLIKYKKAIKALKTPQTIVGNTKLPTLDVLWDKYSEFKEPQVTKGYFRNHFIILMPNAIAKLPSRDLSEAIAIRDFLIKNYSSNSAKRYLTQLSACCDWAFKSKLITDNPFDGLSGDIRVKSYNWRKIDAFTETERDAIVTAYESHVIYSGYTDFVRFLFLTGCRLSEAIALRWGHISRKCDEIYFCESWCQDFGRKATKTDENRKFPCNTQLQEFLIKIRPKHFDSETLVFPSPVDGKPIKINTFLRSWKGNWSHGRFTPGIATQLNESGLVARYRTPYHTRHSFISWCLRSGIPVHQVARWVGNSPEVIYKHYAACIGDVSVPEFSRNF
jgi:integrase